MLPDDPQTLIRSFAPCSAQVALALIVLKSKPVDLSTDDYLGRLCRQVQTNIGHSAYLLPRHLDSTAFWKDSYEKSEAAQAALLDRLHELQHHGGRLKEAGDAPETPVNANGTKRKTGNDSATKANIQSKRKAAPEKAQSASEDKSPSTSVAADICPPDPAFLARAIFQLNLKLTGKHSDPVEISNVLHNVCHALRSMLEQCGCSCGNGTSTTTGGAVAHSGSPSQLQSILASLEKIYPLLSQGLEKIGHGIRVAPQLGRAVHALVSVFEAILIQLGRVAEHQTHQAPEIPQRSSSRAKSNRRMPMKSTTTSVANCYDSSQLLAQLAVLMITHLDLSKPVARQILEGYVTVFLDRLGSSLSLVVFGDQRASEKEQTFVGVRPPTGLRDKSSLGSAIAAETVRLKSRYMVYILDETIKFIDGHQGSLLPSSEALFGIPKSSTQADSRYLQKMTAKLQNTLLKGVFGGDDETFLDSLRSAKSPVHAVPEPPLNTPEDADSWFVGEIWRIIGWDILANGVPS